MTVLLSYMFLSALVGILLQKRPYVYTQLAVLALTFVVVICYYVFQML